MRLRICPVLDFWPKCCPTWPLRPGLALLEFAWTSCSFFSWDFPALSSVMFTRDPAATRPRAKDKILRNLWGPLLEDQGNPTLIVDYNPYGNVDRAMPGGRYLRRAADHSIRTDCWLQRGGRFQRRWNSRHLYFRLYSPSIESRRGTEPLRSPSCTSSGVVVPELSGSCGGFLHVQPLSRRARDLAAAG